MVESRKDRIAKIIEQRRPFLQAIEATQGNLRKRAEALGRLEAVQTRLLHYRLPASIQEPIKALPINQLNQEFQKTVVELEMPKQRFARTTLNIGVVGRARQGKSSLLQNVSDLDQEVIPSGKSGHCTGVRSTILHDPRQQQHGEITFYSEPAFMEEVIAPYYKDLPFLGQSPATFQEFVRSALPTDGSDGQARQTRVGEKLRHLHEYQDHAPEYGSLLGTGPLTVKTQTIREYVAQDDVRGAATYHKYMAVREARIICTFKHGDVGQVALVDMPGLGDTGVGDEERLLRSLGEHTDIVLYVFMPGPLGAALQDVDFDLYDLITRSLDGIPIERWAFMILNHTRIHDNFPNCQRIQQQVLSRQTGRGENSLKFVDCLIADCHDSLEAKTKVLDPLLDYLSLHMHELDETYMAMWDKRLEGLEKAFNRLLDQAQQILGRGTDQSTKFTEAGQLFERELWPGFVTALRELAHETAGQSMLEHSVLQAYFQERFTLCLSDVMLPQLAEIDQQINNFGARPGAMNVLLNEMRTRLTRQFSQIDIPLQIDDVKNRVADTFKRAGKLAELAENKTGKEFFERIAELMPGTMSIHKNAFLAFARYELSLQGLFQNLIRKNVDLLDPEKRVDLFDFSTGRGTQQSQQLQTALRKARDEAIHKWQNVIAGWLRLPNEATLAIVNELIDQTLYSERAEDRWKEFYLAHYQRVWPAYFAESKRREELFQQWQTALDETRNSQRSHALILLPQAKRLAYS